MILWQDSLIHEGVLAALGTDDENLNLEMLGGLEELCLPAPENLVPVTTLAVLSLLTGLKTLELSGHPIEVFDFPEDMPALETLKLADCGCASLKFLEQPCFQGLHELDLSGNKITDLAPLAGLFELTRLNISQNPVTSLEPLTGLSKLKVLYATGTQMEDWSSVAHVEQVEGRPEKSAEISEPSNASEPTTSPSPRLTNTPVPLPTIPVSSVSLSCSEKALDVGAPFRLRTVVSPSNATD